MTRPGPSCGLALALLLSCGGTPTTPDNEAAVVLVDTGVGTVRVERGECGRVSVEDVRAGFDHFRFDPSAIEAGLDTWPVGGLVLRCDRSAGDAEHEFGSYDPAANVLAYHPDPMAGGHKAPWVIGHQLFHWICYDAGLELDCSAVLHCGGVDLTGEVLGCR